VADVTRRIALVGATLALTAAARAERADAAQTTAWDFTFPSIEGATLNFADQRGRVLLVVNTASFCGFTYQYGALEKLHADFSPLGLTVVGVPSQDFNQESGTNGEVKQFCEATFGVQFPMTGLMHVRGRQAHPFYQCRAVQRCLVGCIGSALPHIRGEVRWLIQEGFPNQRISDPWGGNWVGGCHGCILAVVGCSGGRP